jgi:hypothetical protein
MKYRGGKMPKKSVLLSLSMTALIALPFASFMDFKAVDMQTPFMTSSQECKECHAEIYKSWKNSMHAMSLDDPIFKSSYMQSYLNTKGDAKFNCLKCHAPMTLINNDYDLEMETTREGVTCYFCHSLKEVNLADRQAPFKFEKKGIKRASLSNVSSTAHGTEASALFKSSELCAGCHEYTNDKGTKILGTYSEWKEGPYPAEGKQCQDCHMPLVAGNVVKSKIESSGQKQINLHAISAGHSVEQLQKAVKVEIEEIVQSEDFLEVNVSVTNIGSGHKVPTGIPKRKLVLIVDVKTPNEYLSQHKEYTRMLEDEKGNAIEKECEVFMLAAKNSFDNRIGPRETRREIFPFVKPKNKKVTVSARVEYLYETTILNPVEMRVKMAEDSKIVSK